MKIVIIISIVFIVGGIGALGFFLSGNNHIQEESVISSSILEVSEDDDWGIEISKAEYKRLVEEEVYSLYTSNQKVSFNAWTTFRSWELDSLVYLDNSYKVDGKNHVYKARCSLPFVGEDGKNTFYLFYLSIDSETVYWDEDRETDYLDNK